MAALTQCFRGCCVQNILGQIGIIGQDLDIRQKVRRRIQIFQQVLVQIQRILGVFVLFVRTYG